MAAAISVTPSQSFVLRYASRHSLVLIRDLSLVVEGSSCMREKRFATSVSFCSFATGLLKLHSKPLSSTFHS